MSRYTKKTWLERFEYLCNFILKNALYLLLALCLLSCNTRRQQPRNIILMIGDGMGVAHITAAQIKHEGPLALDQFPVTGLHKNASSNNLITDSAAGATAFSCGQKTYNGALGIEAGGKKLNTILEIAHQKGLATGLVVTSSITHATPAAFYSHVKSRASMEDIALDLMKAEVDFFVGGGLKYFDGRRKDGQNLIEQLKTKGYFVSNLETKSISTIKADPSQRFALFTADDQPGSASSGREYLPVASRMGAEYLSGNEKGFFLMVEGSQIDWGGHAKDANQIVSEMLDFDKSIEAVLDFAKKDKNTLVIVTADHECGGFTILKGTTKDSLVTNFSTDYHTAQMIPVFAYGPGAEAFTGVYENTALFSKMVALFGWKP